jgi:hypothetical protein
MIMSLIARVRSLFRSVIGAAKSFSIPQRSLAVRSVETARASRLVLTELLRAREAARICIEKKEWWPPDLQPTSKAWLNLRRHFALELSIEDWSAVVSGFEAVDNLTKEAADTGDAAATVTEEARQRIIPLLADIERGCTALARYFLSQTEDPSPGAQ